MLLLERGANPDQKDSQGRYSILQNTNYCALCGIYRTPKDFASASVKIWPHFAGEVCAFYCPVFVCVALGYSRSPKDDLIAKGITKKVRSITHYTLNL